MVFVNVRRHLRCRPRLAAGGAYPVTATPRASAPLPASWPGLVAITPSCSAVSPVGALILGAIAGIVCALAVGLKYKIGYDDSLDVVGVRTSWVDWSAPCWSGSSPPRPLLRASTACSTAVVSPTDEPGHRCVRGAGVLVRARVDHRVRAQQDGRPAGLRGRQGRQWTAPSTPRVHTN